MRTGVYRIECIVTGDIYIGSSSVSIRQRWAMHRCDLAKNRHHSRLLQALWNEHGPDAFEWKILELCAPTTCIEREQVYLDTLKPNCNRNPKAASCLGAKWTPEARARQSVRRKTDGRPPPLKGKPFPEDAKALLRAKALGRPAPNKGRPMSEESKAKLSASRKGWRMPEEQKARYRLLFAGRPRTAEALAKQSATLTGRKHSPERVQRATESRRGIIPSAETRTKMSAAHIGQRGRLSGGKKRSAEEIEKQKMTIASRSPERRAEISAGKRAAGLLVWQRRRERALAS